MSLTKFVFVLYFTPMTSQPFRAFQKGDIVVAAIDAGKPDARTGKVEGCLNFTPPRYYVRFGRTLRAEQHDHENLVLLDRHVMTALAQ